MVSDKTTGAAIELTNATKIFETKRGPVSALGNVSLSIDRGSFVTIVGPSGCGKTTLLRMMAGLESPSSGSITIHGNPVRLGAGNIGMVFQNATLLPWLTVENNVLLPARLNSRQVKTRARERARELLDLVGLSDFATRYPAELSGGMQQRVGIARALINDPDVLLMDEPFGALDAMTRDHLNTELERIWLQSGKTVAFITHSIPEALMLGDRVLVMSPRPGRIEDDLSVGLPRPRTPEVMAMPDGVKLTTALQSYFSNLAKNDRRRDGGDTNG